MGGWKCDVCGEIYSELDFAEECEQSHLAVVVKKVLYKPGSKMPQAIVVALSEEQPSVTYTFAHVGDPEI